MNNNEFLVEKIDLLSNALLYIKYWKNNFQKCLLASGSKKDNEIDKYTEIIEIFIKNMSQAMESEFNFLKK